MPSLALDASVTSPTHPEAPARIELPDGHVDLMQGHVHRESGLVALTPHEKVLLQTLAAADGALVPTDVLFKTVWGHEQIASSRRLGFAVCRLRKKVEMDPSQPKVLRTVRGRGLRLEMGWDTAPQSALAPRVLEASAWSRPTNRFVGRQEQLAGLERGVSAGQVLSIVGPGGMGKTRLALEFAGQVEDEARTRWVAVCRLENARSPWELIREVAAVLQVPRMTSEEPEAALAQLGHTLSTRGPGVLVFDNGEQLIESLAHHVSRWLKMAPEVAFLHTSREPLHIAGERVFRLGPLSEEDGVQLFFRRLEEQGCEPARVKDGRQSVRALVAMLEGSPLAIELAAARARLFPVPILRARIHEQLDLLMSSQKDASPRQRSLRATIAWSWDLLTEAERAGLMQCAAWEGGFDLEAFESVVQVDKGGDPLDLLESLTDKSVVLVEDGSDGWRFGLATPVRDYLHERAQTEPAWQRLCLDARRRHMNYYRAFRPVARTAAMHVVKTIEDARSLKRELANLQCAHRVALEWEDDAAVVPLALALSLALRRSGLIAEVRTTLSSSLACTTVTGVARGWLLLQRAQIHYSASSAELARRDLREMLDIAAERDAVDLRGYAILAMALVAFLVGEHQKGWAWWNKMEPLDEQDPSLQARACRLAGQILRIEGKPEAARVRLEQALTGFRTLGLSLSAIPVLGDLMVLEGQWGDRQRGLALGEEALSACVALALPDIEAMVRYRLGVLHLYAGQLDRAKEQLTWAQTLYIEHGLLNTVGMLSGDLTLLQFLSGDVDGAESTGRQGMCQLDLHDSAMGRSHCAGTLGYVLAVGRHTEEAAGLLEQAMRDESVYPYLLAQAAAVLGAVRLECGRLEEGNALLERARTWAEQANSNEYLIAGLALAVRAHAEAGRVEEARILRAEIDGYIPTLTQPLSFVILRAIEQMPSPG